MELREHKSSFLIFWTLRTLVLVILVQIIQSAGTHTAVGSDKRLTKKSRRKGLRDANRQVNRDKRTPGAL